MRRVVLASSLEAPTPRTKGFVLRIRLVRSLRYSKCIRSFQTRAPLVFHANTWTRLSDFNEKTEASILDMIKKGNHFLTLRRVIKSGVFYGDSGMPVFMD